MGIDVHFGFKVGDNLVSFKPDDPEKEYEFYNTLLGGYPRAEWDLYKELSHRYHNERDDDKSYALWKALQAFDPFGLEFGIGRSHRVEQKTGVALPGDSGRLEDKTAIRRIIEAHGWNPDAVELLDCVYWG